MSDELLQKIFEKLVDMDKRIISIEQNMATKEELQSVSNKLNATMEQVVKATEEITEFRHETAVQLKRFERRVKSIETDLDETMVRMDKQ